MDVNDSLRAIFARGKIGQRPPDGTGLDDKVLLDELEFLELYQDTAIQAARDLHLVLADGDLADSFDWPGARYRMARVDVAACCSRLPTGGGVWRSFMTVGATNCALLH